MNKRVIAYSSERRPDVRRQIGGAHYSYGFAEAKFVAALRRAGHAPVLVDNPEILKGEATYRAVLGCAPNEVIHIAFRSTENIRPMAGARNVAAFVWEFPVMRDRHLVTDTVSDDQLHMLGLMDEIWGSCQFSLEVYARHGLPHAYRVPPPLVGREPPVRPTDAQVAARLAPIPSVMLTLGAGLPRDVNAGLAAGTMTSLVDHPTVARRLAGEAGGRIVLTICAPGDRRKNLLATLDGFRMAAGPDDLLIVKLALPNVGNFRATAVYDALMPLLGGDACLADPRVLVVSDFVDEDELTALYALADFYLSASHAEGLNLPLLESMALGTVPVATRNTAMLDYLEESCGFVIAERSFPSPIPDMAARVSGQVFDTAIASRFDVGAALHRAMAAPASDVARRGARARDRVQQQFGEAAVMALIEARFAALSHVPVRAP